MDTRSYELPKKLGELLKAKQMMVVTAESCTGGLLATTITDIPGSSDYFDRGFITYSNKAKNDLLGVDIDTLDKFGAVSEQVAVEMAKGALDNSNAQLSVAITGIAGPDGGSVSKPVGTVCFAWTGKTLGTKSATIHFDGDRNTIRMSAVKWVLKQLCG